MRRFTPLIATAVSAAALAAGLLGAATASAATHPQHPAMHENLAATATGTTVKKSDFVAGYVATAKTGGASSSFKYVTATFKVPALSCGSNYSEVYHYAGLGGWADSYLDAAGLDEWCYGGTANYYGSYWDARYYGSNPSNVLSVHAGDTLVASVFYTATYPGTVQIKIVDSTTGTYAEQVLGCDYFECGSSSAEVFTAGNLVSGQGTPNFGKVSFSGIKATAGNEGGAGPLNSSKNTLTEVVEHGPVTNLVDVQPGTLTSASLKSAFANTWERQNGPLQSTKAVAFTAAPARSTGHWQNDGSCTTRGSGGFCDIIGTLHRVGTLYLHVTSSQNGPVSENWTIRCEHRFPVVHRTKNGGAVVKFGRDAIAHNWMHTDYKCAVSVQGQAPDNGTSHFWLRGFKRS